MSKALIKRELLYGSSEFKIICLAQVVSKIRVKLHSSKYLVVVLTDYCAIKGIIKRTTIITNSVDRANRRLINANIYLSEYNLKIYHVPSRKNIVPNALSRLPAKLLLKEQEELEKCKDTANLDKLWPEIKTWLTIKALMNKTTYR